MFKGVKDIMVSPTAQRPPSTLEDLKTLVLKANPHDPLPPDDDHVGLIRALSARLQDYYESTVEIKAMDIPLFAEWLLFITPQVDLPEGAQSKPRRMMLPQSLHAGGQVAMWPPPSQHHARIAAHQAPPAQVHLPAQV